MTHQRPVTTMTQSLYGSLFRGALMSWLPVVLAALLFPACAGAQVVDRYNVVREEQGAFFTGIYPDLFTQLSGVTADSVRLKIDAAFQQLFYGDDRTGRVYYPVGSSMAYIEDIGNKDVRTEGMSYGMMIAVQLDKKEEFDRLWRWAKANMQFSSGPHRGYFAWHCRTDGTKLDSTAASDGEEWFVTALFFASARWGDGEGDLQYSEEAQRILATMLHKEDEADHGTVTNMFSRQDTLVAFVPSARADHFTDPSYQVPHYYELWGRWAARDNAFWCAAARTSRRLLQRAVHPRTGLAPDYSGYDGAPMDWGRQGHAEFRFDAWRVAMNTALDWLWFQRDPWQVEQSNRLLRFFAGQGIGTYGNQYTLEGKQLDMPHSTGLVAMNAVAALAATDPVRVEFVRALWGLNAPTGQYRYYDGMLYLLGLLQCSGNFRIYTPAGLSRTGCP
jgi:oligosaccharide reducing-end xylanase